MGNAQSRSTDRAWPSFRGQCLDFIHREDQRDLLYTLRDLGSIRAAAPFLIDTPPGLLSGRLRRALHAKRLDDGTRLDSVVSFGDPHDGLEGAEALKAMWLVEHQRWDEAADALRFASQCRFCQLPAIITREDLQRHRTKQAFLAEPRVVALWKMVGRRVDFGELGRFELFDDASCGLRAIKDEEAFQIRLAPPLPADHRFQQHTDPHNPIVAHRINVFLQAQDHVLDEDVIEASFSSYLMHTITTRIKGASGSRESEPDMIDAGVMARLDRSVHRPFVGNVAGASAVMAIEYPAGVHHRYAVLTPLDHPFATVYGVREGPREDQVNVLAVTTEPRASVADDELRFSQMHPQTTAVASRFFGLILGGDDEDDTSSSSGSEEGKEGGGDVSTHDDGSTSHDADTENDDDAPAIANTEDAPMAVEDNGGGKEDSTHQ
mmetsp:Transcript_24987/g.72109  ORF Transcript_24987/g.72109 Transcript_24987/m.72109 type:complete len:435 (-) Transcript_24987:273-1577(-)